MTDNNSGDPKEALRLEFVAAFCLGAWKPVWDEPFFNWLLITEECIQLAKLYRRCSGLTHLEERFVVMVEGWVK